jgi:hypothetical protein
MSYCKAIATYVVPPVTLHAALLCLCLAIGSQVLTAEELNNFYVREYRVTGANRLKKLEVE